MLRPRSERRSPWLAIVLASLFLLLPILYLASIGPAGAILGNSGSSVDFRRFRTAFAPIVFCVKACPALGRPLTWWVKACDRNEDYIFFDHDTGELSMIDSA